MDVPINYLALILCAVVAVALGMLWYGPLFGKPWRKEMGVTEEDAKQMMNNPSARKKMMKSSLIAAVGAFIMAYGLAHTLVFGDAYLHMTGVEAGLQGSFWSWLSFCVPVLLGAVLWENKTWKWWFITIGYYLVDLLLMGIILSVWH